MARLKFGRILFRNHLTHWIFPQFESTYRTDDPSSIALQYSKQRSRCVKWLTYNRTRLTLLRENGANGTMAGPPSRTSLS
jgi:hypothetical protein